MRAAGPPQRAAEDRGAGMPRRRRNLAAVMANRRPQREAVEHGTALFICIMQRFSTNTVMPSYVM